MRAGLRASVALTALTAALAIAGCGDGDGSGSSGTGGLPAVGGGGVLGYALTELPPGIDPLAARTRAEQIVSRQAYEPLAATSLGPYGGRRRRAGLATTISPSPDRRAWTLVLRPGVSFQDGTPFNVAAALANARRWSSTRRGQRLLPGLFAADTPRPGVIRLLFESPRPDAPRLLTSPRLGVVSPEALEPISGERADLRPGARAGGTGPFIIGARNDRRVQLTRYAAWWGGALGLGPALDSILFLREPTPLQRLRALQDGQVQVAEPLGRAGARAVRRDPLLGSLGGAGGIGVAASVRGLAAPPVVPQLSRVWLTTIG